MKLTSIWGLALTVLMTATSGADVVMLVDVTDPTAVTFTATSNTSEVDDASADPVDGIRLLSFLTVDSDNPDIPVAGTLAPASVPSATYDFGDFSYDPPLSLGLWYNGSASTQVFSTSSPAFTGSSVANLSGFALPAPGATGNVVAGDDVTGSGATIGQWQVVTAVPEPSSFLFLALAGIPVGYSRWRKKTAAAAPSE